MTFLLSMLDQTRGGANGEPTEGPGAAMTHEHDPTMQGPILRRAMSIHDCRVRAFNINSDLDNLTGLDNATHGIRLHSCTLGPPRAGT